MALVAVQTHFAKLQSDAKSSDLPWFDIALDGVSKSEFDEAKTWAWDELHAPLTTKVEPTVVAMPTTIDSENRERDAQRIVEKFRLRHPELGSAEAQLWVGNRLVSTGYLRILFGDHGPYFELEESFVNWTCFTRHVLKGPKRHYHEHYTEDGEVKLYEQFNGVDGEPNPPEGDFAVANNRPEGYAPCRAGCCTCLRMGWTDLLSRLERR